MHKVHWEEDTEGAADIGMQSMSRFRSLSGVCVCLLLSLCRLVPDARLRHQSCSSGIRATGTCADHAQPVLEYECAAVLRMVRRGRAL